MATVLWLRQEGFKFIEAARVWPDAQVRRRLSYLAEECQLLSMEMEGLMTRAEAQGATDALARGGDRIAAAGRH